MKPWLLSPSDSIEYCLTLDTDNLHEVKASFDLVI